MKTKKNLYGKLRTVLHLRINSVKLKQSETLFKKNIFLNFYFYNFFLKNYKNKNFFIMYNNFLKNNKNKEFIMLLFSLKDQFYNDYVNFLKILKNNLNKIVFINKNNLSNYYYNLNKNMFILLNGMNYLLKGDLNFLSLLDENTNKDIIIKEKLSIYDSNLYIFFINFNMHIYNVIEYYKILVLIQFNLFFKN